MRILENYTKEEAVNLLNGIYIQFPELSPVYNDQNEPVALADEDGNEIVRMIIIHSDSSFAIRVDDNNIERSMNIVEYINRN